LGVPVIALSQLNRLAEGMSPKLSHLRESGAIEQDADIVMFLHPGNAPDEPTELIIAKNREGKTGRLNLQWMPSVTTFKEMPREYPGFDIAADEEF